MLNIRLLQFKMQCFYYYYHNMKAINNREDIELLVNKFYEKVKVDETIGYIFNEIANINWDKHLPKMYDFW